MSPFYKQRMRCRGLIHPEGRALMAPGTLRRALHQTKARGVPDLPDALPCHLSAVTPCSENTETTAHALVSSAVFVS
jgi:hypothetical protein